MQEANGRGNSQSAVPYQNTSLIAVIKLTQLSDGVEHRPERSYGTARRVLSGQRHVARSFGVLSVPLFFATVVCVNLK